MRLFCICLCLLLPFSSFAQKASPKPGKLEINDTIEPENPKLGAGSKKYWVSDWALGSTIDVYFVNGYASQKEFVANTANEWARYGNFQFRFHSEPMPAKGAYGIVVALDGMGMSTVGAGSSSPDRPSLHLWVKEGATTVILHEFGHALGLLHEMNNPESLEYLKPITQNTYDALEMYLNWSHAEADKNLIKKIVPPEFKKKFDPLSVMGYDQNVLGDLYDGKVEMHPGNSLSEGDKAYIALLYPGRKTPVTFEKVKFVEAPDMVAEPARTFLWKTQRLALEIPASYQVRSESSSKLEFANTELTAQIQMSPGNYGDENMEKIGLGLKSTLFDGLTLKGIYWSGSGSNSEGDKGYSYDKFDAKVTVKGVELTFIILVIDWNIENSGKYKGIAMFKKHDLLSDQVSNLIANLKYH